MNLGCKSHATASARVLVKRCRCAGGFLEKVLGFDVFYVADVLADEGFIVKQDGGGAV